jgi:hypothetical protein
MYPYLYVPHSLACFARIAGSALSALLFLRAHPIIARCRKRWMSGSSRAQAPDAMAPALTAGGTRWGSPAATRPARCIDDAATGRADPISRPCVQIRATAVGTACGACAVMMANGVRMQRPRWRAVSRAHAHDGGAAGQIAARRKPCPSSGVDAHRHGAVRLGNARGQSQNGRRRGSCCFGRRNAASGRVGRLLDALSVTGRPQNAHHTEHWRLLACSVPISGPVRRMLLRSIGSIRLDSARVEPDSGRLGLDAGRVGLDTAGGVGQTDRRLQLQQIRAPSSGTCAHDGGRRAVPRQIAVSGLQDAATRPRVTVCRTADLSRKRACRAALHCAVPGDGKREVRERKVRRHCSLIV